MQAVSVSCRRLIVRSKPVLMNQKRFASKKFVFPKVTMNDMPSPEGDFYTHNNALQRSNNMQLVLGICSVIVSIAFGLATNRFEFYNDIPEPAEIECYKD